MDNIRRSYKVVTESGDEFIIHELKSPLYETRVPGDGRTHYYTKKEVDELNSSRFIRGDKAEIIREDDPNYWIRPRISSFRSLQECYDVCKLMKDEVVSMTLIPHDKVNKE